MKILTLTSSYTVGIRSFHSKNNGNSPDGRLGQRQQILLCCPIAGREQL